MTDVEEVQSLKCRTLICIYEWWSNGDGGKLSYVKSGLDYPYVTRRFVIVNSGHFDSINGFGKTLSEEHS